jgi:predicted alpha/beta superfamily hydrolase
MRTLKAAPFGRLGLATMIWLLASAAQPLPAQRTRGPIPERGQLVTLPRARQYDFTSRITGRPYRLTITPPVHPDSSLLYPVLYVLDGTAWLSTSSEVATVFGATGQTGTGYVVAIGYQTADVMVASELRSLDLTPFRALDPQDAKVTGGGDAFLRAIYEEVQPYILSHFRVDRARQAIWGHSLGGMLIARSLLRDPGKFATYLLASPTLSKSVLVDEAAFFERAKRENMSLRVLISVGGEEPPSRYPLMYDEPSTFAARLQASAPQLTVKYVVFPGEGHLPAGAMSLIQGIEFAWPRRP